MRCVKNSLENIDWGAWSDDLDVEILKQEQTNNDITSPSDLLRSLDNAINKVTEAHSKKKIVTNHSKPYWTTRLTSLSQELRKARKCYTKRNTDINKKILNEAKERFDEARREECQEFILKKTKNLNSAEAAKFWKEFKKYFFYFSRYSKIF